MHKKLLAVALVVLMLALGGVRLKANCNRTGGRSVGRCVGNGCMKYGKYAPHYRVTIFGQYTCYDENGSPYYREEKENEYNSGCC